MTLRVGCNGNTKRRWVVWSDDPHLRHWYDRDAKGNIRRFATREAAEKSLAKQNELQWTLDQARECARRLSQTDLWTKENLRNIRLYGGIRTSYLFGDPMGLFTSHIDLSEFVSFERYNERNKT